MNKYIVVTIIELLSLYTLTCQSTDSLIKHTMIGDPTYDCIITSRSSYIKALSYLEMITSSKFENKTKLISLIKEDYILYNELYDSVISVYNEINKLIFNGEKKHSNFIFIDLNRAKFYKIIENPDVKLNRENLSCYYKGGNIKLPWDYKKMNLIEYKLFDSTVIESSEDVISNIIAITENSHILRHEYKKKKQWSKSDEEIYKHGWSYINSLYYLKGLLEKYKSNWHLLSSLLSKYYLFLNYTEDEAVTVMLNLFNSRSQELNFINAGFNLVE